jgi:hypothetical protein
MFSVNFNRVGPRINPCSQFCDDLAIDPYFSGKDQFLAVTPGTDSGNGEIFLQPDFWVF